LTGVGWVRGERKTAVEPTVFMTKDVRGGIRGREREAASLRAGREREGFRSGGRGAARGEEKKYRGGRVGEKGG